MCGMSSSARAAQLPLPLPAQLPPALLPELRRPRERVSGLRAPKQEPSGAAESQGVQQGLARSVPFAAGEGAGRIQFGCRVLRTRRIQQSEFLLFCRII